MTLFVKVLFTPLHETLSKYTPEGGTVTLTLEKRSQTALLTVTDSGIGIPEDALPHLFEEFYRAPNAKAQPKTGNRSRTRHHEGHREPVRRQSTGQQ